MKGRNVQHQLHEDGMKHDRELIEKSFSDFEKGLTISDREMVDRFGKYGWN